MHHAELPARLTVLYLPLSLPQDFMSAAQKSITLKGCLYLLLWLASGSVTVIVAQLMKADLAKGWAAWLQALVTIGVGVGFLAVCGMYVEKVLSNPFILSLLAQCHKGASMCCVPPWPEATLPAMMLSADMYSK